MRAERPPRALVSIQKIRRGARRADYLASLLSAALVALLAALLAAAGELVVFWLQDPAPLNVQGSAFPVALALAALGQPSSGTALLLLIPVLIGLVVFFTVGLTRRPLALRAYARAVRSARRRASAAPPFSTTTPLYETSVAYYQHSSARTVLPQKQDLTLPALAQLPDDHLLILGMPGCGKTLLLSHLQESALSAYLKRGQRGGRLPVYISLEHYSLYLNRRLSIDFVASPGASGAASPSAGSAEKPEQAALHLEATLFDFLREGDLPGLRHLRPYLARLAGRGELLLLCDDFHLVDVTLRDAVASELLYWMNETGNRLVLTSCDLTQEALPQLERLLDEGSMACALLLPLQPLQMRRFLEHALDQRPAAARLSYSAGELLQTIEASGLRYFGALPLTLITLLEVLAVADLEEPGFCETRGLLFECLVSGLASAERRAQTRSRRKSPSPEEMAAFLRWLACAMYWAGARNALPLTPPKRRADRPATARELALSLQRWLTQNRPRGPTAAAEEPEASFLSDLGRLTGLVTFALEAGLLVADGYQLRFGHSWLAEYCVAAYFRAAEEEESTESQTGRAGELLPPLLTDFCADVVRWSGPVAMWAGLLADPLPLAERFVAIGEAEPAHRVAALLFALICVGAAWKPPRLLSEEPLTLPPRTLRALTALLRDPPALESLARLISRCAAEGALEIYQGLLPLLMVPGAEALLRLCEQPPLLERLFDYLCEAIDLPAYDAQVRRLIPILGHLGEAVIPRAAELVLPAPDRSLRLRAAAVRILARSEAPEAVPPLLDCLNDSEQLIVEGALKALIHLGPARALDPLLMELEQYLPGASAARQVQRAVLLVLDYFLSETEPQRRLSDDERRRVLETVFPLLSGQQPLEVQRAAREVLVRQLQQQPERELVDLLVRALASPDEQLVRNAIRVLQQGDARITPWLLEYLEPQPSEVVRMHLVEILGGLRDLQALPYLLKLLADPAPMVRQQVGIALQHAYVPESIPGLIELVLRSSDEQVAARAARILRDMGDEVVEPILQALPQVVAGRTQLLVQVLEELHDPRTIPALVALLRESRIEPLLTVAVIRTLARFADPQVAAPLIELLGSQETLVCEAAISALSRLREHALGELIEALDVAPEQETPVVGRVRRAILGMEPFPGEQLIAVLLHGSEAQIRQVGQILLERGADAALLLVNYLFHPNARLREVVRQILQAMPGQILVPALLEGLNRPTWRQVLAEYLLRYPAEAIPPLIGLLGDPERGDAAVAILLQFGPEILPALVPGLSHEDDLARRRAQQLITALGRQQPECLPQIVRLFGPSLPPRAHEGLVEILAGDLADLAVPALLEGLGDAYLLAGVSEVLARLARRRLSPAGREALAGLIQALRSEERRHGAEITLMELGEPAVAPLGELITDADPQVARAAQRILRDIGAPALPFIWSACSDMNNRQRREAALEIFRSMPTLVIKDELLTHLASEHIQESSMAATLLRERIHDEASHADPARQEMVPALLEYVQSPESDEQVCRRVIALLLLIGGAPVVGHLSQALYERPGRREWLMRCFLFLGQEGEEALWEMYHDPETPPELANSVVSMLGMLAAYPEICELALSLSHYGLTLKKDSLQSPDQLEISLRALGGLLAGGHWNVETLQELRRRSKEGSIERDLIDVLLGWRYGAYITHLENDLQSIEEAHREDLRNLTVQLLQARSRISDVEHEREALEEAFKKAQDDLNRSRQELAHLTQELHRLQQEHGSRSDELEQAQQTIQRLQERLNLVLQEKRMLQDQINQLHAHNAQLVEQLNLLQGAENP
jgi:HEAT repeat protein